MSKENKAKVRVFFAEFEGDNETIRDGLQSIAVAVNKTFQSGPPPVKLIAISGKADEKLGQAVQQSLATEIEEPDEILLDEPKPEGQKPPRAGNGKSRKSYPCSLVKGLDLQPAGKHSLRQFFDEKAPKNQQEYILVALSYLVHVLEIQKVSVDHVFTALKAVQKRIPDDLPQAIRTISNRKGWFESGDKDDLKITIVGDNYVEHDLSGKTISA